MENQAVLTPFQKKINAIKTYLNNKPYKLSKKINSVVIGGVALASTIIGGSAYLGRDKNYSDTFMQIKPSEMSDNLNTCGRD